jgi:hypothetical protein
MILTIINISAELEITAKNELIAKIIKPIEKDFFNPNFPESLPSGTEKTAKDKRKEMTIQFCITPLIANCLAIEGRATAIAEVVNEDKNNAIADIIRIYFFS